LEVTGTKGYSLRGRRDLSRAQSFGLVEEKKPRGEWGGDALKFSRAFGARLLAALPREWRLRRQNYARKYNSASYAG